MTWRRSGIAAIGLAAALIAGFVLAGLPIPLAAATIVAAAPIGLVYGARSALGSFQAAADGRRINAPWWIQIAIVLGVVLLEQFWSGIGIVGPIAASFVLIVIATSFVYSAVYLRSNG